MLPDSDLTSAAERLGLPVVAGILRRFGALPAAKPAVEAQAPAGLPAHLAVLVRASTGTPQPSEIAALVSWLEGRPIEQALLGFDLCSTVLADEVALRLWSRWMAPYRTVLPAAPARAIPLADDLFWESLADSTRTRSDAELVASAKELDLAALAELLRRGHPLSPVELARWIGWAESLAVAHLDTWSSAIAGLLARECGSTKALAIWGDTLGDEGLYFPARTSLEVGVSTFGPARDKVPARDLRLVQLGLRLRRASANLELAPIVDALGLPVPSGGDPAAVLRVAAARIEASVRVKRPAPLVAETTRLSIEHPSCAYARWACLLGLAATPDSTALSLSELIDEHRRQFGGLGVWYDQLARHTVSDVVFAGLIARLVGDLRANPARPALWIAVGVCAAEGAESIAARGEVLARVERQLGGSAPAGLPAPS